MLTVQEIQAMSFEKAVFGGYDMKSVDEFIEHLTEDFAALQKENAALKSKMKVLVDKIEEYRSVETGMRRALVSAQNIAQETIDKSKLEAEQLLVQTKNEKELLLSEYNVKIGQEQNRLTQAKRQCVDFISKMTAYYEDQLMGLVSLSASDELQGGMQISDTSPAPQVAPLAEETQQLIKTRELGLSHDARKPVSEEREYTIPDDIRKFMDEQQSSQEGMQVQTMGVPLNEDADGVEQGTSKFSFGELKFGSDYAPQNEN